MDMNHRYQKSSEDSHLHLPTMKILLVFATVLVASQAVPYMELLKEEWKLFQVQHSKRYSSPSEEQQRLKIYLENRKKIAEHNERYEKGEVTYKMDMNQYGDLSHHEFLAKLGLKDRSESVFSRNGMPYSPSNVEAPSTIDWRQKGAVTPVKNQGGCGSCWSFSATGAIEGQHFIKTGKLVSLSEQNLIDCTKSYGNNGCGGGWMDNAFRYVEANGGIDTESSYPYEEKDTNACRYNAQYKGASIRSHTDIQAGNEGQLLNAVGNVGPIAVAFDASHSSFQFYSTGIYYEPDCETNNPVHAVLVVGYGAEGGSDYWLVKNSWDTWWGDQGYFKIARNRNNHCGIATYASYPSV